MSGNSFGLLYCVTSFGESHGPAYGGVVDGCPPGLALSVEDIQVELNRRKPGTSRHVTQRRESDKVEILSGVVQGRTTGTAIGFLVRNEDSRPKDYSALETLVRVAAGAIAKKWLRQRYGVRIWGHLAELGPHRIPFKEKAFINKNPFFAANASIIP